MNRNKKITLFILIMVGVIIPFIPTIVVIEMFFLLIPFGFIFLGTLIYLLICFFYKKKGIRNALFIFSILPTFILTQLLSVLTVHKIQKYRSQTFIDELKKHKERTGEYPESFYMPLGIYYKRMPKKEYFNLEYSRGFMVTQKFDSKSEKWETIGWND